MVTILTVIKSLPLVSWLEAQLAFTEGRFNCEQTAEKRIKVGTTPFLSFPLLVWPFGVSKLSIYTHISACIQILFITQTGRKTREKNRRERQY